MTPAEMQMAAAQLRASAMGYVGPAVEALRAAAAAVETDGRAMMAGSLLAGADRLERQGSAYLGRAASLLERAAVDPREVDDG